MAGLPEYMRVFTAIELDPEIRSAIAQEASGLLSGVGKVGLVPEDNLHVTLKFVGEVHRDDLAALDEVVAEGAERLIGGEVEVGGIGAFPNLGRPRVVWAGVSDPTGMLTPVHDRLNETLARFGAKREKKRYVPHVTLARVRGPFDAETFGERLESAEEIWFGAQVVESVTLFLSELSKSGPPTYTVLGHYGGS